MHRWCLSILLLLLPHLAWSASFKLVWEFPRAVAPRLSHFLVTISGLDTESTLTLPPSEVGACGEPGEDVYCGTLPECLPQGFYEFHVQAVSVEGEVGPPNDNQVICVTVQGLPCVCQVTEILTAPPAPSADLPAPLVEMTPAVAQAALPAATSLPQPALTTPAAGTKPLGTGTSLSGLSLPTFPALAPPTTPT